MLAGVTDLKALAVRLSAAAHQKQPWENALNLYAVY